MVVKLAPTMSSRIIAIKKLNNIMINCLQNPRASVLPDKWRFDSSQDWETLALDFGGCSTDDIADETFRALGFQISATGYLEEGFPRFTDVTDLELSAELAMVDNPGQVVTDSEEEVVKKKNKRAAKRKERLAKLHAPVGSPLSSRPESSILLSPRSVPALVLALVPTPMPALVPTLMPAPVPAFFSCPGSFVVLSSDCLPALAAVSRRALMSPLPVLGPPLLLGPSPLRTFKQSLSDEPRPRVSTSPAKLLHPFPALGALNPNDNNGSYNPTDKNKCKRGFDIAFISSRPLAGNHDKEEVDLSFAGCGCPAAVKLNRSWQLDLLDPKPVCIIKAIPLASALFWDLSFAPYTRHTLKLAFKLGLRTNKIKSGVMKERIEAVWANRTISLLDRLFRDNPEWWIATAIVYTQLAIKS